MYTEIMNFLFFVVVQIHVIYTVIETLKCKKKKKKPSKPDLNRILGCSENGPRRANIYKSVLNYQNNRYYSYYKNITKLKITL